MHVAQQGSLAGELVRVTVTEERGEKATAEPVTLKTGGKFVFIGHRPHVFALIAEENPFSGQLQVVFTCVMTEPLPTAPQRACLLCDTR